MSDPLDILIERAREHFRLHPPTQEDKDEHAINFVLGNLNASTNHQTTRETVAAQYYKLQHAAALAQIEALQKERDAIRNLFAFRGVRWESGADVAAIIGHTLTLAKQQHDEARAEVADLRKDKERLDWLQLNRADLEQTLRDSMWTCFPTNQESSDGNTAREAIDAAMALDPCGLRANL